MLEGVFGFLVAMLLSGVAVILVSKIVPGVELEGGLGDAIVVGVVYGVLKGLLLKALIVVTAPLVLLTLGLFIVVLNAFLLWLTEKLLDRFEVKSKTALVVAALLLSVCDVVFHLVLGHGTLF